MLFATWVHGNVARAQWVGDPPIMQAQDVRADGAVGGVPWTDIVGLPQGPHMIFRGRDRSRSAFGARVVPQRSIYFHIPLPTPVILRNQRARLMTVFVLWTADPEIVLQEVFVFDGPRSIPIDFSTPAGGGRDGSRGFADLIPGMTSFSAPSQPEVLLVLVFLSVLGSPRMEMLFLPQPAPILKCPTHNQEMWIGPRDVLVSPAYCD
jgi:hypothetical protein